MSRKIREDVGERLRRGKSQDGGPASVIHARNTTNFLSPDASSHGGVTSLERAPSLNRLHAQSSTETSGLGETVTSGFSSQESVHSFVGDDKDRGGAGNPWERSRRRGGGGSSPAGGGGPRQVSDYDYVDRDGHLGSLNARHHQQHQTPLHAHNSKSVTFTKAPRGQEIGGQSNKSDDRPRSAQAYVNSEANQGNPTRRYRDTGGRSLTPQQAKEEQEARRKQVHVVSDKRKPGSGSLVVDAQPSRRTDSLDRQQKSATDVVEAQDRSFSSRERSSSAGSSYPECDVRRRLRSTSGSRESSIAEADREYQRQNSSGAKTERAFVLVGRSRPNSKDGSPASPAARVSGRSHGKDQAPPVTTTAARANSWSNNKDNVTSAPAVRRGSRSGNKDAVDNPSTSRSNGKAVGGVDGAPAVYHVRTSARSNSRERAQHTSLNVSSAWEGGADGIVNRDKVASDPSVRDREKRSRSREQSRSQSSSSRTNSDEHHESSGSKKSCDTVVRLKSQSQDSKLNFEEEPAPTTDAVKPKKDHAYKPVIEPTIQVNVESSLRRKRTPVIVDGRQEAFSGYKTVIESNNREDGSQFGKKSREEQQRRLSTKLPLVDSRIPYEKHKNEPQGERREREQGSVNLRPKGSEFRITKPDLEGQTGAESVRIRTDSTSSKLTSKQPAKRGAESDFVETSEPLRRKPNERAHLKTEQLKLPQSERRERRSEHEGRRDSECDERFSVYDAEVVSPSVGEDRSEMDYDLFFHQASRGVNGTGGVAGAPDTGGTLRRSTADTQHLPPGETRARSRTGISAPNTRSAPYTKFQVPTTPMGPIPTVQLITSPEVPGLNIDAIHKEWERRGSKGSLRSHHSNKSSGPKFLGVTTESAWTKWSRDRRASYRRRLEKMERTEIETNEVVRISTPVKKARQEGLKFVHPDLEARYLSEDDLNELRRHKQQQVHVMRVIERNRKNKFRMKTEVKLSAEQWHALQVFWEHTLFVRARYLGLVISILALIFMIVSIAKNDWLSHGE
ncbi:hypothetical protein Btru_071345 [Bulinus truncatus]|nr:hypothetical protein Btru_071345 [Bulinus truncatus]